MEELKKKHGVKISGSTLDRIVLKGKEAKGGVVCLERKKYDRSNKSHLTEEVKEDYIELITEFSGILGASMPTRRNSRDWKLSPIISRE